MIFVVAICFFCGCSGKNIETVYFPFEDLEYDIRDLNIVTVTPTVTPSPTPTAEVVFNYEVIDVERDEDEDALITAKVAFLLDLTDSEVIFSKNIHKKIYPA